MFIREDRKSFIFTRNFALKFDYPKATRFRQNLSYNFHLLSMLRDRRSFRGLKHAVDRDKSVTFHMFIREDRKSVIFTRKFDLSLAIKKQTGFRQNRSYNFNLLSMPRVKRSYHRLKQTLDRGNSVTFPYVY